MQVEEVPAQEQFMGMTSEPTVQTNMQFFFKGLIWPVPDAIKVRIDQAAQVDSDLLDDTTKWIKTVLKPEFVAPDLPSRLRAARAIVSGEDAFLARYRMNQTSIQIVVTRFHVHLVLVPVGDTPIGAIHRYLRVDDPREEHPWDAAWRTGQIDNLTFGYQARSTPADWRESINYLTNGKAIKFSLKKIPIRPGTSHGAKGFVATTDEAERIWFSSKN
jgi:hypothetical protein